MNNHTPQKPRLFWIGFSAMIAFVVIMIGGVLLVQTQAQETDQLACYTRMAAAMETAVAQQAQYTQQAQTIAPTWTAQAAQYFQTQTAVAPYLPQTATAQMATNQAYATYAPQTATAIAATNYAVSTAYVQTATAYAATQTAIAPYLPQTAIASSATYQARQTAYYVTVDAQQRANDATATAYMQQYGVTTTTTPTGTATPTAPPSATINPIMNASLSNVQTTATALARVFATPQAAMVTPVAQITNAAFVGTAQAVPMMATPAALPNTGGGGSGAPIAAMALSSSGSGGAPAMGMASTRMPPTPMVVPQDMFFENYGVNPFIETADDSLSTFAMDVDTASYSLTRNYLLFSQTLPPPDAIRPEEFINYFPMNYGQPAGDDAFALHLDAAPSPFRDDTLLLRVGLQGRSVSAEDRDPVLLIFVVDVSGSMQDNNRMGTVRDALRILAGQLREDDTVGIVTFTDYANRLLEPVPASEVDTILAAIETLYPMNNTNAEAGLCFGYQMALENLKLSLNTRVIFLSDGVANVGFTQPDEIQQTISDATKQGITLTSIGVGMGNFNDVLLEQLADNGDGNYFYVDNVREARRVFANNLVSTLQVIAYDARIQVDFNPDAVSRYRLIGYENRAIADEDFRADETVDAAEIGAGHTITALYEVEPNPQAQPNSELATTFVRYEEAESREVVEVNQTITLDDIYSNFKDAPDDFRLLAGIAEFSELLRHSPFVEDGSYDAVAAVLETLMQNNPDVGEVVQMVVTAGQLSGQ